MWDHRALGTHQARMEVRLVGTNINFNHVNCLHLRIDETPAIPVGGCQKKEVSHPNRCLVVEISSGFLYGFALHFYCLFTFVK